MYTLHQGTLNSTHNLNRPRPSARGLARPGLSRPPLVISAAKKGDKKGGDKKGPKKSALADLLKKKNAAAEPASGAGSAGQPATPAQFDNPETRMLAFQICDSYWRLTKKYLLEGVDFDSLATALYWAPFAVLAHDRFQEGVTDPCYTYANRAALALFEHTWEDMIGTPSRKSAVEEPGTQQNRNALLDKAADTGVVTGYEGWRVAASGRRFKVKDLTLFNVLDRDGTKLGQAAMFDRYETEEGVLVTITADPAAVAAAQGGAAAAPAIPTPEDIEAAEAAVAEQAAAIRDMKEAQGMKNQDIPVQIAVLELKKRKDRLVALQKALEDALAASKAAFDDDD